MPAADHGKRGGTVDVRTVGELCYRLHASVDDIRIDFAFVLRREGAHAEHAVFALQRDLKTFGNEIGHVRRHADSEIDMKSVLQLLRCPFARLIACPGHQATPIESPLVNGRIVFAWRVIFSTNCSDRYKSSKNSFFSSGVRRSWPAMRR